MLAGIPHCQVTFYGVGCGSSGVTTRSVPHLARALARGPCLLLPPLATGAFAGRVAPPMIGAER